MERKILTIIVILVVALVVSLCAAALLYNQNLNQQQTISNINQQKAQDQINEQIYSDIMHSIEDDNQGAIFSPPIQLGDALRAAYGRYETGVWNETTLDMLGTTRVDVKLVYGYVDEAANSTVVLNVVTSPQASYSHVQNNGVTYRYMYQIIAYDADAEIMPLTHYGCVLVDAETREILPIPPS